ncbi:MAG TPA: hypothetical protein VFN28_00355, partial [Amaricoccus sp.]|nr:hypothetical protein [Amaricoccus sp.]
MNSYVGKDITAAMVDYGPPAASFELPDGRSAFQWRMAYGVPIPATTTYTGTTWGGTTTGN